MLIAKRRIELGLHKIDAARAAGITITTYNKAEAGEPVRDVTYRKIELVLGWAQGTCRDVLDRAAQISMAESLPALNMSYPLTATHDLQTDIENSVQAAAIAVTDNLTAADIRELKRYVIEELRRRGRLPPSKN
ncbi:helix-turn-helix transcriptional regulator [Streptomyces sp. NPDC003077]|uniref:helix-turn-helix transcriptional regulator n=1 Tax=Streptomyces sp. NPDC003077 TaxID=3154443 RepID=UPI0033B0FC34